MTGSNAEILKTIKLDSKNSVSIEKIHCVNECARYVVKSFVRSWIGKKQTTLAAWNIETDFNGNRIVKIEYRDFRILKQAIDYTKHVKNNIYPFWIKQND